MQLTIRTKLKQKPDGLDSLMRIYQSGKRFAFNRLLEDRLTDNELKKLIMQLFEINARYAYACIVDAKEIIKSQRELLPVYVYELDRKICKSKAKLNEVKDRLKQKGIKARIRKLERKRKLFEKCIEGGIIPKIVFGGRKNLELLRKGKITNKEWKELRNNQLYSVGGEIDGGNLNLRLFYVKDNRFKLRINIGNRKWVWVDLSVNEKFLLYLINQLQSGKAYSIRLMRKNGYYAHISFDVDNNAMPNNNGVAGLDINTNGIAVTITYPDGNFKISKWFKEPQLIYVRANKRNWLIGNLVKQISEWIKSYGVNTVVIEKLKFKNIFDTNHKFNRKVAGFVHSKIKQIVQSRCIKDNLALKEVSSAYSSIIGKYKYKNMFGLNEHQSASYIIAKRGLGYVEAVPKPLVILMNSYKFVRSLNSMEEWKRWKLVNEFIRKVANSKLGNKPALNHSRMENSQALGENPSLTGDIVKPACIKTGEIKT